ncbi:MAG TPA: ABC transporter permease subunit [Acidimicrobiia bacterium]|nr:ABC transporter permease subunit [Acidimicrobiia bacterium]
MIQVVALAAIVGVLYVLWFNLINNLKRQGITTNFAFLDDPIGVNIAGSDISSGASIQRGLLNGIKNTFALVVFGLPILTVVGVLVGIARLSTNWLVAKAATLYVETLRNIPPLLVIFIAFYVLVLPLPPPNQAATPLGLFVISNLRISVPWFETVEQTSFTWFLVAAAVVAVAIMWWRSRLYDQTGQPHHRILWGAGAFVAIAGGAWLLLGRPVRISVPTVEGRVVTGGLGGLGSYFAMLIALSLYTASHVAEIVRGSIQAVPKGQTEAANALALSGFQRLRHVILPQAMRIAIPPIINQYLNYTKNTSLAIAIGYAEVTLIAFQAIGNGNPAPQLILLLMAAYLAFSLTISLILNLFNRRLRYVGR